MSRTMAFRDDAGERTLPYSLEAERSVLGAVLAGNEAFHVAARAIGERDFFRDAHRRTFAAMARLVAAGVVVDFVTLKEELSRAGELDECGGPVYVAGLGDGVPTATNVAAYAAIVREKSRLRDVIHAANRQLQDAYEAVDPAAVIAERGMRGLAEAAEATAGGLVQAQDAVVSYISSVSGGTLGLPLPTGYLDLDALLRGGLRPADLVIVAARPSVGKTAFALCAAEAMAAAGRPVAFFSLEMSQASLASRLLALRSGVPSALVESQQASEAQYRRVGDAMEAPATPLLLEFTARTVAEIHAWCRQARRDTGLACVMVDYLQLLAPAQRHARDDVEVAGISHALKRLARDLDVVVVALSQLSRAPEARRDKRPALSDLRGSGALEQDCDVAILLYREDMYSRDPEVLGIAEAIVAKHRNGPTGTARLVFLQELAKFANLAHGD